jgi:F-type H+-transporting ATPase subunit epsilon
MSDHATALHLTVVTPGKRVVQDIPVTEVTLPGANGQLQVLPEHTELMAVLKTGPLVYHQAGIAAAKMVAISHGYAEVQKNHVLVLADTAETKEEIDAERARRAQQKAETVLREGGVDLTELRKYELKLQRSVVRQAIAGS